MTASDPDDELTGEQEYVFCERTGKVCHASRRVAEAAMKCQKRNLDYRGRDREPMTVFLCRFGCGSWHAGRLDLSRRTPVRGKRADPPTIDLEDVA